MSGYQFNNTGIDLFDLLSVAVSIPYAEPKVAPSEMRKGFIKWLGKKDLWSPYKNSHPRIDQRPIDDLNFKLLRLTHSGNEDKNYNSLDRILHGRVEDENDVAAIEDICQLLKILDNPNDIEGQKFLFGLLKEWEKIPEFKRYSTGFSEVCERFLLEPNKSFRINDPKMKKDLLFMIADNADWMDRFWWYDQMLRQNDLNFDAKEVQYLYDKMLKSKYGFEEYYEREYRDTDKEKVKQYAEDALKNAKERLDMVVAQEQNKTQEIKQEQQPDLRSEQEQPVKEEPKSSIKVTKVMTYDDLMRENETLKKQVEYWKSLYSMQRANASIRTTPVMQRNPYEKN